MGISKIMTNLTNSTKKKESRPAVRPSILLHLPAGAACGFLNRAVRRMHRESYAARGQAGSAGFAGPHKAHPTFG